MQAKEFFAQYAVLPLSRRGGSEGAKKNNGGVEGNCNHHHHANKENVRRSSSSIQQHQHHQPNTEIDDHADVDSRSMTMTKTISRSSIQSSPSMRSIATTAAASQHSSFSTAITMTIPNRIELISPDGKKRLKLTSWDPTPVVVDRRSMHREYVTHRTAHRTTFDDRKLIEIGQQTRRKLMKKEEQRRESEKLFLKEVIASNRRKRLSCSSNDRMMSCSCFASTLLSLQSRSDSTGSCSEPAAVEKSASTDSSNAPSPPPLGCPVDAVTSDHLISFQSLLKVSESSLYCIYDHHRSIRSS